MMIACWSVKGGSGVSVVAAGLAIGLARRTPSGALFVDLAGDGPSVLGVPAPDGPGLSDWLRSGDDLPADALSRLEVNIGSGLSMLAMGDASIDSFTRVDVLAGLLTADSRPVVIDAGCLTAPLGDTIGGRCELARRLSASATHSWLVTRSCYLSLRRAANAPLLPSGVVLVTEPGRALGRRDVEDVVGVDVVAEVPVDPQVARAVDSGLFLHRLPRPLGRALRHAA